MVKSGYVWINEILYMYGTSYGPSNALPGYFGRP